MLNVTGAGIALNANYILSMGNVTLTGNPIINVSNNGTGAGTLILGALDDGGTARTLSFNGAGAVTLASPATSLVTGTKINVGSGTLNSNNATALAANAKVTLSTGGTLNLGASQTLASIAAADSISRLKLNGNFLTVGNSQNLSSTFAGVISGDGLLTKAGTGTLTLTGANTLSAGINVYAGALQVNGSITGSPASGALAVGGVAASGTPTLSGGGSLANAVTIDSGNGGASGHLAPGANTTLTSGAVGTLITGTLTLNAGAVLDFDFGTPGAGLPSTGGSSDSVAVNGNLTFPAGGSIFLNFTDNANTGGNGAIGIGTYRLFTFTGQLLNFNANTSIVIGTTALAGKSYLFSQVGNEIDITISNGNKSLTWTGLESNAWNTTALNWYNESTAASDKYVDGNFSLVTFQDSVPGAGGPVTQNSILIQGTGVTPNLVVFKNTAAGVAYTLNNASGVIGISGGTGIQFNGTGTVSLLGANTYTGTTFLSSGRLIIKDPSALGSSTGTIAPLIFNGGTLQYAAAATGTDFSNHPVTISAGGATIDTNGQTATLFNSIGNNGAGALALNDTAATPGKLILGAANTFTGTTTVARGTLQFGNGTVDGSVKGAIVNNDALIFNTFADTNAANLISGIGTLTKIGSAALTLSAANTYSGTTTITTGTLVAPKNNSLGTGLINLNGGTLRLAGNVPGPAIGINFATGRNGTENYPVTGTAGVYPMSNWNNVTGLTGTNVALVDNSGTAVATQLTFSGAPVTYSSFGATQANQDAQLLNCYLDTNAANPTITVTLTNIPYPTYRIYVYVGSDGNGRNGHVTIGQQSYYFITDTNPFVGFIQATGTAPGSGIPSNYALFDNLSGSNVTITQVRDDNNCGVMGIEIVNTAQTMPNAVAVNANSTIDLTGAGGASLGATTIGARTLNVTGQSTAIDAPYILSLGNTTLTGNPVFNVANNGAGTGTLSLKSLSDGGTARIISVNQTPASAGTLVLAGAAPTLTNGTQVQVSNGTLRLATPNALGAKPVITTVTQLANFNGGGQTLGGSIRGIGTVTGSVILSSGGSIWPGFSEVVIPPLANDEQLGIGPGVNVDLSAGAKLKIAITNSGGTIHKQYLSVAGGPQGAGSITLGANAVLSLGVGTGAYTGTNANGGTDIPLVVGAPGFPVITAKFGSVLGLPAGWTVVYQNFGLDIVGDPTPTNFADTILLRTTAAGVTPITLAAFNATTDGAGVRIDWDCLSELQNAGFNILRRQAAQQEPRTLLSGPESNCAWTRINLSQIPGRITAADAKSYHLYDWPAPGTYEYALESISTNGTREIHTEFMRTVVVDPNTPAAATLSDEGANAAIATAESTMQLERGRALADIFRAKSDTLAQTSRVERVDFSKLDQESRAKRGAAVHPSPLGGEGPGVRGTGTETISIRSAATLAASARWFSATPVSQSSVAAKAIYRAPGVLKIPATLLPAGFDHRHVTIQREGRALTALAVTPDALLVNAPGYQDDYTDKDALFFRASSAPTAAGQITRAQGLFTSTASTTSASTARIDFHDVYFDFELRPYTFEPWFSSQYLTSNTLQSFTLNTPFAASSSATLTLTLWSLTPGDHALQLAVNGRPIGQIVWTGGDKMLQLSFTLPSGALIAGANRIDLLTPPEAGGETQLALLHSIAADFTRALDGSSPVTITNSTTTPQLFELNKLPTADAWVVDTRFPDRAALVPYETQTESGGTFRLRFTAPSGGSGQFLVVPAGLENLPLAVTKRTLKPVKPSTYFVTGPSQFSTGVQPLLTLRAKEGLRGAFVDQEQLFDYYNAGRYGPAAIRNAVRATQPRYLLLLGRTTYDYRNYSGLNVDPLCPTFLVPTALWSQATSDSLFGDLGRGYPEVAVGRLPVNNTAELRGAVTRIVNYKGAPISGVRVHAAADRADPAAGDFGAQSDTIAAANPDLAWQRNYLGQTAQSSPEVSAALNDAANGAADWLLYVGHGNAVRLGKDDPRILQTDAQFDTVKYWTGSAVLLQSTCTAHWMAKNETGFKSIAIQALTQPQGGISASIGTSTYMDSHCAAEFMSRLMQTAGRGNVRWGDALMRTQQWAASQPAAAQSFYADLNRTEQLFGDPAMPVFQKSTAPAKSQPLGGAF